MQRAVLLLCWLLLLHHCHAVNPGEYRFIFLNGRYVVGELRPVLQTRIPVFVVFSSREISQWFFAKEAQEEETGFYSEQRRFPFGRHTVCTKRITVNANRYCECQFKDPLSCERKAAFTQRIGLNVQPDVRCPNALVSRQRVRQKQCPYYRESAGGFVPASWQTVDCKITIREYVRYIRVACSLLLMQCKIRCGTLIQYEKKERNSKLYRKRAERKTT